MRVGSRILRRVPRLVCLLSLLLSTNVSARPALAQPTEIEAVRPPAGLAQVVISAPPSPDTLERLGLQRPQAGDLTELSLQVAETVVTQVLPAVGASPEATDVGGLPNNLSGRGAQSPAVLTLLNSSGSSNFRDVMLMANASGREDNTADHGRHVADLSLSTLPAGWMLTRAAMSEHTIANGFTESVYYYGDSLGNVYVGVDTTGGGQVITTTVLNLPTLLNAFGSLQSDSQIVITGLAVNPVADLSSFARVNGSFAPFDTLIGEILYVSFWDTGGGTRLTATGQVVQSGVLAFPIADLVSPVAAPPGIQSHQDFPITIGGAFGVAFSVFANVAGVAVDDDGSLYFQQVDLTNFTGANIVKMTSVDSPLTGGWQDRSLATNGFANLTTLDPFGSTYGQVSGPFNQVSRVTNFSGSSTTFGNVVSLAAGPHNTLYAALARSYSISDTVEIQNTAGLFTNPEALGPTPSMIISLADTTGAFDSCTSPLTGEPGSLPVADGVADAALAGLTREAGVNNFRAFVLGTGPDVRGQLAGSTISDTLKIDFQIDGTVFSGLAVDEENKVYVIAGGTPAGLGRNPSPNLSEILVFPDHQTFDRRADFIDLRSHTVPVLPSVNLNVGDGLSTRYDHLYFTAPNDQLTLTPVGVAGLARGFLLYLNRTRNDPARFTDLPNGSPQGDDATHGPLFFEAFDAGHQIAGGDDQNSPFRGDDNDGAGSPTLVGPLNGGFEFVYRSTVTATQALNSEAWNAFYLNSNGSLTFGAGDTSNTPEAHEFLSGLPRLAGLWTNLNPNARSSAENTFPVQALGFANINHFVVRWINVPTFGLEGCNAQNSFSINLFDAGTGLDPNASQPLNPANPIGNNAVPFDLQQGRTDFRFIQDAHNLQPAGYNARPANSGNVCYNYGHMDLLGAAGYDATLVGASPGGQVITTTPGINLSAAALAGETAFPDQLGVAIDPFDPALASPYELFTLGEPASFTVTNDITTTFAAEPVFDLRHAGNDPALSTPINQPDTNRGQVCFYNLAHQSITFDPIDDQLILFTPISVTASASSGLALSLLSLTPSVCQVGSFPTVNLLSSGECILRAGQSGDTFYAPARYVDRSFIVFDVIFFPVVVMEALLSTP